MNEKYLKSCNPNVCLELVFIFLTNATTSKDLPTYLPMIKMDKY